MREKISPRSRSSSGGREDRLRGFVRVIDVGEHPVIVALADRVELVVVALGALHRQAQHGLADRVHAVEHGLHAELFRIGPALLVDHRVAQEARRNALLLRGARQQVARDLLDDEPVIGHVRVERVNDPVAVEPDLARLVLFKAVRVGVARGVKPDAAPALAVVRRCQQAPCQAVVSVGSRVLQVTLDLRKRWGQPGQVKAQPSNQCLPAGARRRLQPFALELGQHEAVNRTRGFVALLQPGRLGSGGRGECPVLVQSGLGACAARPVRAGFDPVLDQRYLGIPEPPSGRHAVSHAYACHAAVDRTRLGIVGHDPRPARAGCARHAAGIEAQLAELLPLAVAGVAIFAEDGLDVCGEVGTAGHGGEDRGQNDGRNLAHPASSPHTIAESRGGAPLARQPIGGAIPAAGRLGTRCANSARPSAAA